MSSDDVEVSKGIVVNPQRCGGRPTVKGSRITADMLARLMSGPQALTPGEIIELYPLLSYRDLINVKLWVRRERNKRPA